MGFKLCRLKTQVWFKDEKHTKHNVLSPLLISNKHSQRSVWSCGSCCFSPKLRSSEDRTLIEDSMDSPAVLLLCVFPSSPVAFICKFLLCLWDRKIWKSPSIYPPIAPSLQEIQTEVVKSGQKRWIKTPGVNRNVTPLSLVIRSTKTHLNNRCKQDMPVGGGHQNKVLANIKQTVY